MQYLFNSRLTFHLSVSTGWQGNPFENEEFKYLRNPFRPDFGALLKWFFSPNPQRAEKKADNWSPPVAADVTYLDDRNDDWIVWLGHASFLIQLNGTYDLSNEPASEPITWATRLMQQSGRAAQLVQPAVGEAWWC